MSILTMKTLINLNPTKIERILIWTRGKCNQINLHFFCNFSKNYRNLFCHCNRDILLLFFLKKNWCIAVTEIESGQ